MFNATTTDGISYFHHYIIYFFISLPHIFTGLQVKATNLYINNWKNVENNIRTKKMDSIHLPIHNFSPTKHRIVRVFLHWQAETQIINVSRLHRNICFSFPITLRNQVWTKVLNSAFNLWYQGTFCSLHSLIWISLFSKERYMIYYITQLFLQIRKVFFRRYLLIKDISLLRPTLWYTTVHPLWWKIFVFKFWCMPEAYKKFSV